MRDVCPHQLLRVVQGERAAGADALLVDRLVHALQLAVRLRVVLLLGFTKIRYYGLLSPTGRTDLDRARHLLTLHAAPHAAAGGATTSREVTQHNGGHATVDAPDACSGGDGDTTCVAVVCLLAIPAVRHCPVCGRGALRLVARSRRSRAPPS